MSNLFKDLLFDNEIVKELKSVKLNNEMLYNHLCNGRITLQEYLSAAKKVD